MESFDTMHENYMRHHIRVRKGERLRRLKEGHGHAERLFLQQVWLKAFGDFQDLHPEYEVKDFRDGTRFIDFAFTRHSLRIAIEIDGYSTHGASISRTQFSDQLMRQNHLVIDGWKVLRFAYDDVKDRPRMCEQLLLQFMGKYLGEPHLSVGEMSFIEKEICRFALVSNRFIKPNDICDLLRIGHKKSRRILHEMTEKSLLLPAGEGQQRIKSYRLHPSTISTLTC
ncbi:DNA-binding response regulator [Paenibacillus sp. SI8]|uniref:DNA-binding response regulator n=1 Tax=unclassified Paenibacillus TaxID=185978 RepID=UPI00346768D0